MLNGNIVLTAAGFLNPVILELVNRLHETKNQSRVAIITTASKDKENNKYARLAKTQFELIGFKEIDFVDIEIQKNFSFEPYNIVYVCGGNTFTLMKFAHDSGLKHSIKNLLYRGGTYIGVSAGSVIAGPSIKIANELSPDKNEVNLNNLEGMGIVDATIYPHYENKDENMVKKFEAKYKLKVYRLNNNQALFINNVERKIVE